MGIKHTTRVAGTDISKSAVYGENHTIEGGTIVTADIADNAITTNKILDGAVTSAKIAANTIVQADLAEGITEIPIGFLIYKSGSTHYARNGSTGAILTSGADASTVIQAALNQNKNLFLKDATYSLSASLAYNINKQSIIAESWNVLLQAANSLNANLINLNGKQQCILQGATIDGNYTQQTSGNGVDLPTSSNETIIKDCHIINCKENGIYAASSHYHHIEHNTIETNQLHGIYLNVAGSSRILLNNLGSNGYDGLLCYNASNTNRIIGNRATTNDRLGINIQLNSRDNVIYNNYTTGNVGNIAKGVAYGVGIYIVSIAGNGNNVVMGNSCESEAIGIEAESAYGTIIVGNTVRDSNRTGIFLNTDTGDNIVSDNLCVNNGKGGIANYLYGIGLLNSVRNAINGNRCFDTQTPKTQSYGIREWGTSDYNIIAINNLINNLTGGISFVGANTKISKNLGYVTENSGTSTGTGAQQTIAHGCAFTPTYDNVFLSERSTGGALPYQSAAPDATNIYVTAVNAKTYNWRVERL